MKFKSKSPFTITEHSGHRFIYYKGELLYKQYLNHKESSVLFRRNGWPSYKV